MRLKRISDLQIWARKIKKKPWQQQAAIHTKHLIL